MKNHQAFKLKINAIIDSFNVHTGEVTKTTKIHNLVVDTGLERVAHLIGGLSSTPFEYVAIGTDNTAVVAGDTELGTEVDRANVIPTDVGIGSILYDYTFTFSSGESFTIVEAGLFDSLTASGSTMLDRLVFSGHDVDVDNGIRVRITVSVTRP